jgi:hypothetical protein
MGTGNNQYLIKWKVSEAVVKTTETQPFNISGEKTVQES